MLYSSLHNSFKTKDTQSRWSLPFLFPIISKKLLKTRQVVLPHFPCRLLALPENLRFNHCSSSLLTFTDITQHITYRNTHHQGQLCHRGERERKKTPPKDCSVDLQRGPTFTSQPSAQIHTPTAVHRFHAAERPEPAPIKHQTQQPNWLNLHLHQHVAQGAWVWDECWLVHPGLVPSKKQKLVQQSRDSVTMLHPCNEACPRLWQHSHQ